MQIPNTANQIVNMDLSTPPFNVTHSRLVAPPVGMQIRSMEPLLNICPTLSADLTVNPRDIYDETMDVDSSSPVRTPPNDAKSLRRSDRQTTKSSAVETPHPTAVDKLGNGSGNTVGTADNPIDVDQLCVAGRIVEVIDLREDHVCILALVVFLIANDEQCREICRNPHSTPFL
jgi:hypothetical protein